MGRHVGWILTSGLALMTSFIAAVIMLSQSCSRSSISILISSLEIRPQAATGLGDGVHTVELVSRSNALDLDRCIFSNAP